MMGHLNPHHSVNWFVCLRVPRFNGNSLKLSLTSSSPGGGNCLSLPRSFFLHPRGVFWVISVNKSWVVLNSKPHCVDKGRILFEFNKIPDFQSDNQLGSFFIPCVSSKKQRVEKVKCDSFLFGQTITYLSCVCAKASETLTGRGFVSEASLSRLRRKDLKPLFSWNAASPSWALTACCCISFVSPSECVWKVEHKANKIQEK